MKSLAKPEKLKKRITIPTKPWAPYKPQPPAKEIEEKRKLSVLTSQEGSTFSIQWFVDYVHKNFPNEDPVNVRLSMEINKTYCDYNYDEIGTSLDFTFYTVSMIPNPKYDSMYTYYEQQLDKYEADYKKYKLDLEKYNFDEKQYKKDLEQWQVDYAKEVLAKHEEKKKGKKK